MASFEYSENALAARFLHYVRLWTILDVHVVSYRRGGGASASLILILDVLDGVCDADLSPILRSTTDRILYV
jgi:hypothetical protein